MKNLIKYLCLFFFVFTSSFSCKTTNETKVTEDIIKMINDNPLPPEFLNTTIHYRSKGENLLSDIYFVSKDGRCGPLVVDVRNGQVTGIDEELFNLSSCKSSVMSEIEIKRKMEIFLKYNVYGLSVDSIGNVFVQSSPNGKFDVLKIKYKSDTTFYKDIGYERYRDVWFVR